MQLRNCALSLSLSLSLYIYKIKSLFFPIVNKSMFSKYINFDFMVTGLRICDKPIIKATKKYRLYTLLGVINCFFHCSCSLIKNLN